MRRLERPEPGLHRKICAGRDRARPPKNFSGAIILMHEGPSVPPGVRLEAIGAVLQRLAVDEYRCIIPSPDSLR